jgi:hypothetical protein
MVRKSVNGELSLRIPRIHQTISAEAEEIVERPRNLAPFDRALAAESDGSARCLEPLRIADRGDAKGIGMTCICVREPPAGRIEHSVEDSEVHLGRVELGTQTLEQGRERFIRRDRGSRVNARSGHDEGHDQRRGESMG